MAFYTAIKKEIMKFARKLVQLEIIVLSKINQIAWHPLM